MADEWWTDNDDDDDSQRPAKRPELPEPARAHLRKVEQELKALREENVKLKATRRLTTVADIVKAKGFDPEIADFIPADVDASDDAVSKWLESKGKFFAKPTTESPEVTDGAAGGDASTQGHSITPEAAAALNLVSSVSAGAMTPQRESDMITKIQSSTKDQLMDLLRSQGATV